MVELSRRDFLKAGLAIGGGLTALRHVDRIEHTDPTFKVEFDRQMGLSFKDASNLALKFDRLTDLLPEPKIDTSGESLSNLVIEIIPNMEYEGITDSAKPPKMADYAKYLDGRRHNHVLGQSDCENWIVVNYKYANPHSRLYEDAGVIATITHELVHLQQGQLCAPWERENVEQTAQIGALEVMAGMANSGNSEMIYPLIDELRGMSAGTAYSIALREGRLGDYEKLRNKLSRTPEDEARYRRARRYWQKSPDELRFVLKAYNEVPMNKIVGAIIKGDNKIEGLALPPKLSNKEPYIAKRDFIVDDLAYFIKHSEEIVRYTARQLHGKGK